MAYSLRSNNNEGIDGMILDRGCIQVYTGDGKGKTTAAFGIALRMVGAGGKVFVGQFLKGRPSGEVEISSVLDGLTVEQFGAPTFVFSSDGTHRKQDTDAALAGLKRVEEVLASGQYDMIVMDEINVAADLGLIDAASVLALLEKKPERTEVILTGRMTDPDVFSQITEAADLVTEMKPIKHYYDAGVAARRGIEE
jgi:cob(I)alamin adenosyltransferase